MRNYKANTANLSIQIGPTVKASECMVQRPTRHIIGHFQGELFQAKCTYTHNGTSPSQQLNRKFNLYSKT